LAVVVWSDDFRHGGSRAGRVYSFGLVRTCVGTQLTTSVQAPWEFGNPPQRESPRLERGNELKA
jgi:hypothetical protein